MDLFLNVVGMLGLLLVALLLIALLSIPLAALRNRLVHALYTLFTLLAIPAIVTGRTLLQAKEWLTGHLSDTLEGMRHTGTGTGDDDDEYDVWPGWLILWPLVYLSLLAGLALGDYYLFVLRFEVLFQLNTSNSHVVTVDVWTGVIWVTMVALWGGITFDLSGVMHKASPFHRFSPTLRRHLTIIALGAMITSFIAGAIFWLWAQFDINGIDTPILTWTFVVLFALLINSAIGMAGWAIFLSLGSVYALLLLTTLLLCSLGLFVCYALVSLMNVLAALLASVIDFLAHPGRLLWNWLCCFPLAARMNFLPLEPFGQHVPVGRELTQVLQVSQGQVIRAEQTIDESVRDETTDEVEFPVMYNASLQNTRIVNLVGSGLLARGFLPTLWETFEQYRATSLVRTYGAVDLSRSHTVSFYEQSRYGVIPLSPTASELEKQLDRLSDASDVNRQITDDVITRLVEANLDQRDTQSHIIWAQSLSYMDDTMEQAFRDLIRHRQPHQHLMVYSELPSADQYNDVLVMNYQRLLRLQKENIITSVILLNQRSSYVRLHGEGEQHRAAATMLVSLELAHQQNEYHPTLPEIMHRMALQSAFVGMAFSSKRFAGAGLVNTRRAQSRQQSGQIEHRLVDLIAQSKAATDEALTPGASSIQANIDINKPFFVVYTVPSTIRKSVGWSEYTHQIATWLDRLYPEAIPLFVRASHTRASEGNVVRVAILFPLPDILPVLRANNGTTTATIASNQP